MEQRKDMERKGTVQRKENANQGEKSIEKGKRNGELREKEKEDGNYLLNKYKGLYSLIFIMNMLYSFCFMVASIRKFALLSFISS